jgi:SNF2 family DNA or RNA helicase
MSYSTHGWLGSGGAEVSVDRLTLAATTNPTIRHILPDTLTVYKYHGPKRETDPTKLRNFDIVFTTYATIAAEFCKGTSVIHQLEYYRLVLDEGKNILRVGAERGAEKRYS